MTTSDTSTSVTIRPTELLRFFDERPDGSETHATSIVAVVGEDLNAACFAHYLDANGSTAKILDDRVTTGKRRGPRLDRWIDVRCPDASRTVFQAEIKSWSAHSFGGEVLKVDAGKAAIAEYKQRRWDHHWHSAKNTLVGNETGKVLVSMKPPANVDAKDVRPLLIFWELIGPREHSDKHLFSISNPSNDIPGWPKTWPPPAGFPELWVFSVSSYLRSIKAEMLTLHMPTAARRLSILKDLFKLGD